MSKYLSKIPGLDEAIVGLGLKSGDESYIYSTAKILEILGERMPLDAAQFFLSQAQATWDGPSSPIFIVGSPPRSNDTQV
jgi:hypothetical protein